MLSFLIKLTSSFKVQLSVSSPSPLHTIHLLPSLLSPSSGWESGCTRSNNESPRCHGNSERVNFCQVPRARRNRTALVICARVCMHTCTRGPPRLRGLARIERKPVCLSLRDRKSPFGLPLSLLLQCDSRSVFPSSCRCIVHYLPFKRVPVAYCTAHAPRRHRLRAKSLTCVVASSALPAHAHSRTPLEHKR